MGLVIAFVVGLAVGGILVRLWSYQHSVGALRVDDSDPDEPPYIFLELKEDVSHLYKKKQVVLQVHIKSFVPRQKQPL